MSATPWWEGTVKGVIDAQPFAPRDNLLAALAEQQQSVISFEQLRWLGFSPDAIGVRRERRRLVVVHRGVFTTTHGPLSFEARLWAAALAVSPDGVISHLSAARRWGLVPDGAGTAIHVLNRRILHPTGRLRTHRTRHLTEDDVTMLDGFPITSVARTLLDYADGAREIQVERALNQAEVLRLFDARAMSDVLERANGRRGYGRLVRAVIQFVEMPALTHSELEVRFLQIVRRAGLPHPRVNVRIGEIVVDFHWPELGLVVETDGRGSHLTPRAFEEDRRRDRVLKRMGMDVVRFTRNDVWWRPAEVRNDLESVIALRGEASTTASRVRTVEGRCRL